MEIYFDGIPLHPNCLSSVEINIKDGPTINWYKCDRCHNRKTELPKRFPIDQKTLCVKCQKQYHLLLAFTEE